MATHRPESRSSRPVARTPLSLDPLDAAVTPPPLGPGLAPFADRHRHFAGAAAISDGVAVAGAGGPVAVDVRWTEIAKSSVVVVIEVERFVRFDRFAAANAGRVALFDAWAPAFPPR